jgi:pimeloyl-ACP methyl ester carboxylesterase
MSITRTVHSTKVSRLLAALAAVVTAVALSVSPALAESPSKPSASDGEKPTIVLVHGAWADASSWNRVIARLQSRGYTVYAPPNPLRGLASDAAYIASFVNTLSGPIVLVGHSYGGAVITNAANSTPAVAALVYINAFAPDEGESVLQLVTARPGSALAGDPSQVFDAVPYPGAPAGDVDLYVKQSLFPHAFANDLPGRVGAVLAATQRPVTLSALAEPSGAPAWETIPSWYLVGTRDNVIPPAQQRFMAERADAHTVEVRASHLSMICRPAAVTRLIVEAAEAID